MSLKELLGEELYNQVMEKIPEDKKLILNDGSYIPKSRLDEEIQKRQQSEEQIKQYDEQLKELKKQVKDDEDLTAKIKEYEDYNKQMKQDYEEKIKQMSFEHSLDKAISQAQPRDQKAEKAVKALIDKDKLQFDADSGEITGLKEQLDNIKEEADYLFQKEKLSGNKPNTEGQTPSSKYQNNPFTTEKWNLTEQMRVYQKDPEEAKRLAEAAGKTIN